jgi:hypothetical protein
MREFNTVPHASLTGNRNRGPYSYFHRIAQDTQRPYVRQSATNRLLAQPRTHDVHTLYANRVQQHRGDFVYPETAYSADVENATLASSPAGAELPGRQNNRYPHGGRASVLPDADIDDKAHQKVIALSLLKKSGSRVEVSSLDKAGNELQAEAASHTRQADESSMPLIDWLEQAQARVPLYLEDEPPEPIAQISTDTRPGELSKNINIPGDGPGEGQSLNANPADWNPLTVVQQRQAIKLEAHTRTTDDKTPEPMCTSDSIRVKQVLRQADVDPSVVNIELPGPASLVSAREILIPVSSSRSPATKILEQKFPSASDAASEPSSTALTMSDHNSVQAKADTVAASESSSAAPPMSEHDLRQPGTNKVAASRRRSAIVSSTQVNPAQSASPKTLTATASIQAPNKQRATQLDRLQQALQTQSLLTQAQSKSAEHLSQPAPSQKRVTASINNTMRQAPQTFIVQRNLSAPGMDYAYFERSYSCLIGARGYR